MKKYTLLLITLAILTSCGSQNSTLSQIQDTTNSLENTSKTQSGSVTTLTQLYTSPAGEEEVVFAVTMDGDTISHVEVTPKSPQSQISVTRMENFGKNINSEIDGKTILEAQDIGVVGGSSLTTKAFKAALKDM